MELKDFFERNTRAALAFSGGTDSAYLLYAAKKYGADIRPYFVKTVFQPSFEYEDARRLCTELSVPLRVIEYDILSDGAVVENPENRCYFCKKAMMSRLKALSDDLSDRPGALALAELSVRSPLRECGLTKDKIRELSKAAGLFTWDKPTYACLATRIPTGEKITRDMLYRIEQAENRLRDMGFSDFRVRVFCGAARVQVKANQFNDAARRREEIAKNIKPYFDTILLDTEVR